MAFLNELLDPRISYGFISEPRFRNVRVELPSGKIYRNIQHENATFHYSASYDTLSVDGSHSAIAALSTLRALFFRTRGAHAFRFKDWSDYELSAEEFATGVNGDQTYQLTKTYGTVDGNEWVRNITKPLTSATTFGYTDRTAMKFYVDGVEDTSATVDSSGIVTFNTTITGGESLTATGHFDVPVMFDMDSFPLSIHNLEAGAIQINLMEDRFA